jgi:hypothetical protein
MQKVKNEMSIGDGLTQYAHVIVHAFHLAIIVVDANVALLEDTKLGIHYKKKTFVPRFFMFLRADVHISTYVHQF